MSFHDFGGRRIHLLFSSLVVNLEHYQRFKHQYPIPSRILFCKAKGMEAERGTKSRQYEGACFPVRNSNKFNIESK